MKLYLDSNIVEGTPEELVKYKELSHKTEEKSDEEVFDTEVYSILSPEAQAPLEKIEEEEAPMGYTFWYIDGGVLNHLKVLEASLEGYFEDSKGRRYTYQAVSGLVKPLDRENAREEFEEAKHSGKLLKYYPTIDVLVRDY